MEKSKVYFTDLRALPGTNLLKKLNNLILKAGIQEIDFTEKFAAIKIHFGEPGNLTFLRPNYSKVVADVVKSLDGKPFLTDSNTLYVGKRKNALDHLDSAFLNGFNNLSTGCNIIIADGLKGTDEAYVNVDGEYVKEAKIGHAIMDADIFISLNHFKGHESTGFGGAMKNIGMGSASRAGKMEQHSSGKPTVKSQSCVMCGKCIKNCAHDAISITDENVACIDKNKCVGCGRCIGTCNYNAIYNKYSSANDELNKKIAEYTKAVLQDRPHFHISLVIDVSPYCDCHSGNDVAIIPDVGMFASFDPVALDQACADMANKMPVMPNSLLSDRMESENFHDFHDHFKNSTPSSEWKICLEHAEKIGVGTREYELIEV